MIGYYAMRHHIDAVVFYPSVVMLLFILQAFSLLLFCIRPLKRDYFLIAIAALSFTVAVINVAEPIDLYLNRAHAFVRHVELKREEAHAALAFYRETPDSLPIKYLINMKTAADPVFINNEADLSAFKKPAFFVASESYFNALSQKTAQEFHLIAKDKMGHVPVVVFERNQFAERR